MMRSICQCNPGLLYKSLTWARATARAICPSLLPWDGRFFHGMPNDLWRGNTVARLVNASLRCTQCDGGSAIEKVAYVRQTSSLSTAKEIFPREKSENRKSAILYLRESAIRDSREIAILPNRIFHGERMIIGLLNQKGGVGKTTLAVHIADALARRKKKVLLVDACRNDPSPDRGSRGLDADSSPPPPRDGRGRDRGGVPARR